jgi:hypothetical protein
MHLIVIAHHCLHGVWKTDLADATSTGKNARAGAHDGLVNAMNIVPAKDGEVGIIRGSLEAANNSTWISTT